MEATTKIEDGGPAFPTTGAAPQAWGTAAVGGGLTVRDWFAGQALVGLAMLNLDRAVSVDADLAYQFADAMIAARAPSSP